MSRHVILICGPPGAGKSTYADTLGLTVYDIDRPPWNGDRRTFNAALRQLAADDTAHAAVIRAGATIHARQRAAVTIGATHTVVLATPAATCIERVTDRTQDTQPTHREIAAINDWWTHYEPEPTTTLGPTSESW